jgi:hypothetical protein
MLPQRLAENDAVGIVPAIGELVFAVCPREMNSRKLGKNCLLHFSLQFQVKLECLLPLVLDTN